MADIFPQLSSAKVSPIVHPGSKKGFRQLFQTHKFRAAIPYLKENHKMYYDLIKINEKIMQHFQLLGKDTNESFKPKSLSWDCVVQRLKLKPNRLQNNLDVRLCFVSDSGLYMVKSLFTFGLRKVEKGTFHIYQTTKAGLLLYVLKGGKDVRMAERKLKATEQFFFKKYFLEPNAAYKIPANVAYIMVTYQKTMFSLHVTTELPSFPCRNFDGKKQCETLACDELSEPTPVANPLPSGEATPLEAPPLPAPPLEAPIEAMIISYPVFGQKELLTVTPNLAEWGRQLMHPTYDNPTTNYIPLDIFPSEPIDLRMGSNVEIMTESWVPPEKMQELLNTVLADCV